jgi:CelD/BcsL family acetyltransferase involved in cellulose biosynthesis
VNVRVVTDEPGLRALAPAWDELADAAGATAAARPFWSLPWWRHLGRGRAAVVTVEDAGRLVALAPLHERRIGGQRVVRFLGHGFGAVTELLVRAGAEAAAHEAWKTVLAPRGTRLDLAEYREPAGGLDELRDVARASVRVEASDSCPYLAPAPDYLRGRGKKLRQTVRRARERLADDGLEHSVEVAVAPDEVERVLPDVHAVLERADAPRGRLHVLSAPYAPFTRDVLTQAAAAGRLRIYVGRAGGRVASVDVGFVTRATLELWVGRIEPDLRRFSPGHLAFERIVEHAHAEGLARVDLGLGGDQYKRSWCDESYGTLSVAAASSGAALLAGDVVLGGRSALHAALGRARGLARKLTS